MKTVLLSTVSYALFKTLPALALTLALLFTPPRTTRPDPAGDLLLAGYLLGLSTGLSVLGFLLATAWSSSWRRLAITRAVIIAGGLGLIAPIANLLVAAVASPMLLPLLRSGHWIGVSLHYGVGGVALGAVALLIAKLWPSVGPQPS